MEAKIRIGRTGLINALGFYAIYILCGKLGLSLAMVNSSATAVWPPSGIALAALLLLGRRFWGVVFLGALTVNFFNTGFFVPSLGIGCGNTLEALCGAWLIDRFAGGAGSFNRPRNMLIFSAAGALSSALGATLGLATLALTGNSGPDPTAVWLTWWLGDLTGILLIAPLILLLKQEGARPWSLALGMETLVFGVCLAVAGVLVFGPALGMNSRFHPLAFFFFPAVLWPAFRLGQGETAVTAVMISAFGVWGTIHGHGPFIAGSPNESLLFLQTFMAVKSVTSLAVAAVVAQNRRDVKALNDIQTQLHRQGEALAASNAELEQFAFAASHDLKSPLRAIANLADWIEEDLEGATKPSLVEHMGLMRQRIKRMGSLLDSLLEYSRVGRQNLKMVEVDLGRMAKDVVETLSQRAGIRVILAADFPIFMAAEVPLRQVLSNLVSNAIKHHKSEGYVKISAQDKGENVVIEVEDDGPGIDERYHERIFELFQTLKPKDEVEGSGIGLALVKRTLALHGGSISLKSAPGQGSVFRVTWPKAA
jgi:signal transduction histidine kinase